MISTPRCGDQEKNGKPRRWGCAREGKKHSSSLPLERTSSLSTGQSIDNFSNRSCHNLNLRGVTCILFGALKINLAAAFGLIVEYRVSSSKTTGVRFLRCPFLNRERLRKSFKTMFSTLFLKTSLVTRVTLVLWIGNKTLRKLFTLWEPPLGMPIVWSPYRIMPINWLMVQRRPWRTHVVSLYWRTRHLLLRFRCRTEPVPASTKTHQQLEDFLQTLERSTYSFNARTGQSMWSFSSSLEAKGGGWKEWSVTTWERTRCGQNLGNVTRPRAAGSLWLGPGAKSIRHLTDREGLQIFQLFFNGVSAR